jgi:DNA-binding IclR family transcriptional regulator
MTHSTTDRVLYALYCFSRDTCRIDASELARAVGLTASKAAGALIELERAGLVDAGRARLTLLGLARAVALEASGGGSPTIDLRQARPSARRISLRPVAAAAACSAQAGLQ